jgi:microsomal epoxide hydrolase
MRRAREVMSTGTGYQAIQSTRPQSLAYGLTDSPAGLAGWILEKFHSWSDCHGDLGSTFTMDRLLENLSIYWFTGTINSSIRLYMEAMGSGRPMFPEARVEVPTGHAVYPGEIYHSPRAWAEEAYNIVHWRAMPRGGHFAAMEQPELYAADLAEFTQGLGAASG